MRICVCLLSLGVLLSPLPAVAQHSAPAHERPRLIVSEQAIANARQDAQPASSKQPDSLKNGIIVGMVVGAAALGFMVHHVCNSDFLGSFGIPDDPSCTNDIAIGAAVGAWAGAFGGAGVDALFARGHRRFVVRVPLGK